MSTASTVTPSEAETNLLLANYDRVFLSADTYAPYMIRSWFSNHHFYSNPHTLCTLCFGKAVKTGFYDGASLLEYVFISLTSLDRIRGSKLSNLSYHCVAELNQIQDFTSWFLCHLVSFSHFQFKPLTWFACSWVTIPQGRKSDLSLTAPCTRQPSAAPVTGQRKSKCQ